MHMDVVNTLKEIAEISTSCFDSIPISINIYDTV
jgi:hypothetical protein